QHEYRSRRQNAQGCRHRHYGHRYGRRRRDWRRHWDWRRLHASNQKTSGDRGSHADPTVTTDCKAAASAEPASRVAAAAQAGPAAAAETASQASAAQEMPARAAALLIVHARNFPPPSGEGISASKQTKGKGAPLNGLA